MFVVMNLLLVVLPLVAAAAVVALVVRDRRRTSAVHAGLPPAPGGSLVLHARVLRPDQLVSVSGQFDDTTYGRLVVTPTDLRWDPRAGQPWAVPLSAVTVLGTTGAVSLSPPGVDVEIAGSGRWRLVVSRRPINRFVSNDVKRFAEARTAAEVAALLRAWSAPATPGG